jgi:hypothetical protein
MMEETRLQIRVLNTLQLIKKELGNGEDWEAFNDLLIISRIVPKLPPDCLRQMICLLKPILDLKIKTPPLALNLEPLYRLLALAPIKDPLLSDFLTSSGYLPCKTPA